MARECTSPGLLQKEGVGTEGRDGIGEKKCQAKNSFLRTAFRAVQATAIDVLILMPPALQ